MNGLFGMEDITKYVPGMLAGKELYSSMECLPMYNENIINMCQANRLVALNDIYKVYIPNEMSEEVYSKIYLAMLRSLQKKGSKLAIQQQNLNASKNLSVEAQGVIGGSDCFSIIGVSGIGKSAAISRAASLISQRGVIEIENPYIKVIPCILVQTPFDCSSKGLMLEVLRVVDSYLETNYFEKAIRGRCTTDMMISSVAQVLLNHVGVLIVDEIQNVVHHRKGRQLVSMLTQLINSSGVSICMVGTTEVEEFFSSVNYFARRTLGLKYTTFEYGDYFKKFCETLFSYQYVKQRVDLTSDVVDWLYEHSNGTLALVVTILHDAQEIAILNGKERLDIEGLNQAYHQRMGMVQGFIQPSITKRPQTSSYVKKQIETPFVVFDEVEHEEDEVCLYSLAMKAKESEEDVVEILSKYISIEEVAL